MPETLEAPVKNKSQAMSKSPFGNGKKPDLIIYRLIKTNDRIKGFTRDDTPLYPPYKQFPNTDVIAWEGGERMIRYLRGFDSIFVDEQEKGGRIIPEATLNNPKNKFEIIEGEIKVRPHEKTKLQFLDMCNRNIDSEYRTGKIEPIFGRYSEEKNVTKLIEKQSQQREAMKKAFAASENQIAFHAPYLGIAMIDPATNSQRTFEAVQADYQQMALDHPSNFLKTFDDEDLKLKFYIQKAISDNIISLGLIKGKAVWVHGKDEVCDIADGVKPVDAIFNFCQLKAGETTLNKILEANK
jgi:hypothetical protein